MAFVNRDNCVGLPIHRRLQNQRVTWLARVGIDPKATPALFIGERPGRNPEQRLGPHPILIIQTGIDTAINRSKLRDACGIHMLDRGADPRIVAALYGVGIQSIERLIGMTVKGRRSALHKTHPRAAF